MSVEIPSKLGTNADMLGLQIVPSQSQYLKVSPSTRRYHLLMAKAQENNVSWQEVARLAIDWYLGTFPPKQI